MSVLDCVGEIGLVCPCDTAELGPHSNGSVVVVVNFTNTTLLISFSGIINLR